MHTTAHLPSGELPLQCLYHWEKARANEVFLCQPVGDAGMLQLTWQQAGTQVRSMAAWLRAQDWPVGSCIALLGHNTAHGVLAELAIAMAGHVSVPLYPGFLPATRATLLRHCEARACFIGPLDAEPTLHESLPPDMLCIGLPLATPGLALQWSSLVDNTPPLTTTPVADENTLATILYTPGATGQPKGVVHTVGSMAWALSSATRRLRMQATDRYLSCQPLAHVNERILVQYSALRYGACLYFMGAGESLLSALQRVRPTTLLAPPRLWRHLHDAALQQPSLQHARHALSIPLLRTWAARQILKFLGLDACHWAASHTSALPTDVGRWFRKLELPLTQLYGLTEAGGITHISRPGPWPALEPVHAGIQCRIHPETGEIQLRSPALMQGYLKAAQQTEAALSHDGWLRTGDTGLLDEDGGLHITGRLRESFKTRTGQYVTPAPIEHLLALHSDVEACVVTGANLDHPLALVMLAPHTLHSATDHHRRQRITQALQAHLHAVNAQLQAHEKIDCMAVIPTAWTPQNDLLTPTLHIKRPRIEATYGPQYTQWLQQGQTVVWASV